MSPQLQKLQSTLRTIFEFDHAEDLDFGIYRILNLKRTQTEKFLNELLETYVKDAFKPFEEKAKAKIQGELELLEKQAASMGIKPQDSPTYQEKQKELLSAIDTNKAENEVYAHLAAFFSCYYDNGDFISLRRYKPGKYAIPYEGEEVKLHWANADQYYIKTTEYLSHYTFSVGSKKVTFKLVEAQPDPEANNKVAKEKERVFMLAEEEPEVKDDTLFIYFTYQVKPKKVAGLTEEEDADDTEEVGEDKKVKKTKGTSQDYYLKLAFNQLKRNALVTEHFPELLDPKPTEKDKNRKLLQKHLSAYVGKNTRDFFIHKDLAGFLSRELDFYLKNEVLFIDDLDTEHEVEVHVYLSKIKVIKRIGLKIIAMLAQTENFQKRLWLKNKFVLQSDWCLTLDRVPEKYYPEILQNQKQIQEWMRLFWIQEIEKAEAKDMFSDVTIGFEEVFDNEGKAILNREALSCAFLKQNQNLILDTSFFSQIFKHQVLSVQNHLDDNTNGLLVHSENFQALKFLQNRFLDNIKCIYIDPPYNTGSDGFVYKDSFQHSSWMTMIENRISASLPILNPIGLYYASIDDREQCNLQNIFDFHLGEGNFVANFIWRGGKRNAAKVVSTSHEYILAYSKNLIDYFKSGKNLKVRKEGIDDIYAEYERLKTHLNLDLTNIEKELNSWFKKLPEGHPAKDHNHYHNVDKKGIYFASDISRGGGGGPKFKIKNPLTGNYATVPSRGWAYSTIEELDKDIELELIHFTMDDGVPCYKSYLKENEYQLPETVFYKDRRASSKSLKNIIGKDQFPFPKDHEIIQKILNYINEKEDITLDYFAGSGTTGHAVINLNREDQGDRKFILVEMGEYFDSVTKPRIQKVVYSPNWKNGKPTTRNKPFSHAFKYLRLESYEDTLTNLAESSAFHEGYSSKEAFFVKNASVREDYLLRYALDLESKESLLPQSLFDRPWDAKMNCTRDNAVVQSPIDMPETFNYLLGLVVENQRMARARREKSEAFFPVFVVEGHINPNLVQGREIRVLVIWRNLTGDDACDNLTLNDWFSRQYENPKKADFNLIYVNGDCLLHNVKLAGEEGPVRFKVNLLEGEFARLMWEGTDSKI